MRRMLVSILSLLLGGTTLVVAIDAPAAALTNPWSGSVNVRSVGVDDPPAVVVEDRDFTYTTDTETRWNYTMTWQPLADQASTTYPFDVTMPGTANGLIFWRRTDTANLVYKIGDGTGNYACTVVTTVSWSGDAAPGELLPTLVTVKGAELPDNGGFDTTVTATMSMDDGVETTTVRSGDEVGVDVCNDGSNSSTGPWHDTVTMQLHSDVAPDRLEDTVEVTARSYLQFAPTATATVDLTRRLETGSIAVGARTSTNEVTLPVFSYTGDLAADRMADGTTTPPSAKAPGTYVVTQQPLPGWQVTGGGCTDPTADSAIDVAARTATYRVEDGEDVSCVFTVTPTGKGTLRGSYTYLQTGGNKLKFLNGSQRGTLAVPVGSSVQGIALNSTLRVTVAKYTDSVGLVFNGIDADGTAAQPCLGPGGACAGHVRWTLVDKEFGGTTLEPTTTFIYAGERACFGAVTSCVGTIAVRLHPLSGGVITNVEYAASVSATVRQRVRGPVTIAPLSLGSPRVFAGVSQPLEFVL